MKNFFMLATFALLCLACNPVKEQPASNDELTMLIGTYTEKGAYGVYSYRFNQENGDAFALDSIALENPSYLSLNGDKVYVIIQNNDSTDALCCVSLDKTTGRMDLLNKQLSNRRGPCYVDNNGKIAVTAHYTGGGLVKHNLDADGLVQEAETICLGTVTGTHPNQNGAHVHTSMFAPDGKYLFVTDFSADRLLQFEVGEELTLVDSVKIRPNSGPRHIAFSPDSRFAYVISELSGEITAFSYAHERLETIQTIMSDTVDAQGSADIHITQDGKFLYSSNRLIADGLAVFSRDVETGMLTRVGYQLTGIHPRNFIITPNDKYVLVACRDSDVIQVFERDLETGLLSDTHKDIVVSMPVCVRFDKEH